ncbi:MAG: acyltransferase [Spirochaetes bacterium]|nr:acyltransferase [Spirochaetota bacterium]
MSASRLGFRGDLQGLRAIAVLAVLVFHVWPKIFRGGFIGVDVFFVISGFLITGIIVGEIEKEKKLDLLRFWGRRMLRLLPAASVVLVFALVGTLLFLPRTDWLKGAEQVFAAALYAENWALVAQATDYWAQGQSPTAVQHYWSLSIEEQFYFVWPPLLAFSGFLARMVRVSVRGFAGTFIFLIFTFSLYMSVSGAHWAGTPYFTTATRAWELALGALLALFGEKILATPAVKAAAGWLGLVAIFVSIFFINESLPFPGWIALVPTVGTALVIWAEAAPYAPYRLLALKPAQYIGDISYSLYLWHWPVIIFFKPFGDEFAKAYFPALVLALTFALAIISKYFIEDPFRFGRFSFRIPNSTRRHFIVGAFMTSAILIVVTAGSAHVTKLFEEKSQRLLEEENERSYDKDPRYPGAAALDPKKPAPVPAGVPLKPNLRIAERDTRWRFFECMNRGRTCEFGDANAKTTVALVGDSHAMSYGPAFEIIAKRQGWRLVMMVKVACTIGDYPFWSDGKYRSDCDWWRSRVLRKMAEVKPHFIISVGGRQGVYGERPGKERQIQGYQTTIAKFQSLGAKMIVMADNPVMLTSLHGGWIEMPKCLLWKGIESSYCFKSRQITLDSLSDNLVEAAQGMVGVGAINLTAYMCTKDLCPPVIGNVVVYRDAHHLTETFVRTLVPYLEKELLRTMKSRN